MGIDISETALGQVQRNLARSKLKNVEVRLEPDDQGLVFARLISRIYGPKQRTSRSITPVDHVVVRVVDNHCPRNVGAEACFAEY